MRDLDRIKRQISGFIWVAQVWKLLKVMKTTKFAKINVCCILLIGMHAVAAWYFNHSLVGRYKNLIMENYLQIMGLRKKRKIKSCVRKIIQRQQFQITVMFLKKQHVSKEKLKAPVIKRRIHIKSNLHCKL